MNNFIVFEGIDGVGTTTQSYMMYEYLKYLIGKNKVVWTKEPTDYCIGYLIREILGGTEEKPSGNAMELLFRADRMDHVENFIRPKIEEGKWVICDRYYPSTLVYQGIQDTMLDSIKKMKNMFNRFVDDDGIIIPVLTIILDADVDICQSRIKDRDTHCEIYESIEFQLKIKELYLEWANADGILGSHNDINELFYSFNKKIVVDANGSEKEVHDRCKKVLCDVLSDALGIDWNSLEDIK
jgi:dTMP kinase